MTQIELTRTAFSVRLRRFIQKSWPEKLRAGGLFVRNVFPNIPIPVRLPSGPWFMAWQNDLGNNILTGGFEEPECAFVRRFLRQGMVVLDIGANEGYYTVLASRCVGSRGMVIGFEPSSRERRRLQVNLLINHCSNTRVEGIAMGSAEGQVDLHIVEVGETGCNSLRPPDVKGKTRAVQVAVTTLDQFLSRNRIQKIDFIKMDIEGAELSALRGAIGLLRTLPRPLLLIEVFDIRTRPWGYSASEIVKLVNEAGFLLYRVAENGDLIPIDIATDGLNANFIAVPDERMSEILSFMSAQETKYVYS